MKVEILGAHHENFGEIQYLSILIDDVLALDAGCLAARLTLARQKNIKAILLSHLHYDHVRDIPAIAMNNYYGKSTVKIYATQDTCQGITKYLLNGDVYPEFYAIPPSAPAVEMSAVSPGQNYKILGYDVTPVSVKHTPGAVAYHLVDHKGKGIFFTGDTAPGFGRHVDAKSSSLIISEVTFPNKAREHALLWNHMTPELLRAELSSILEKNGSVPPVLAVHMESRSEPQIRAELKQVSRDLNVKIDVAEEGLIINL